MFLNHALVRLWFSVPKLAEDYKALNPMRQVPAVEIDGIALSQSVSLLSTLHKIILSYYLY